MFKKNESIRTVVTEFHILPQIIIKLLVKIDYKNLLI